MEDHFSLYIVTCHQNIIRSEKGIKEGKTLRIFVVYILWKCFVFSQPHSLQCHTHTIARARAREPGQLIYTPTHTYIGSLDCEFERAPRDYNHRQGKNLG